MSAGTPLVCSNFGPGDVRSNPVVPSALTTSEPYPKSGVAGSPGGSCCVVNLAIRTVYSFFTTFPFASRVTVGLYVESRGNGWVNFGIVVGSRMGASAVPPVPAEPVVVVTAAPAAGSSAVSADDLAVTSSSSGTAPHAIKLKQPSAIDAGPIQVLP